MSKAFRIISLILVACFTLAVVVSTVALVKWAIFGKSGNTPHVAVVDLRGVIYSSEKFVEQIQSHLDDSSVKAIVVRIASPGGLVGPSQEIYEAIRRADAKVPTLATIGALGASGGYYAALGARKIYSNPGALTASIGVIMELANTEKLYQWAKVERYTLKAGKFKDTGTSLRPMKPEERELLEKMLVDIHTQFRQTVKERRNLNDAELENTTDGRVMTGNQAFQAKLVDSLEGIEGAIKEAKKLAGLPEKSKVDYPDTEHGLLYKLIFGEEARTPIDGVLTSINQLVSAPRWRLMMLAPIE